MYLFCIEILNKKLAKSYNEKSKISLFFTSWKKAKKGEKKVANINYKQNVSKK